MQSNENMDIYNATNEYTLTELLGHFDSSIVLAIMQDKISNSRYSSIPESNLILSFEENFNIMKQKFAGDGYNINLVRERVYSDIISILCNHYNLYFSEYDQTIDKYTAAYYAYDFLVCNKNKIMIDFFTNFIINNSDSLYNALNMDAYKKNKDSSTIYNKKLYKNNKYAILAANIEKIIKFMATIDISLVDIFKTTYVNLSVVDMLSNAFADKGDFFKNYYISILNKPDELPIIITDIKLKLLQNCNTINGGELLDMYINKNNGGK